MLGTSLGTELESSNPIQSVVTSLLERDVYLLQLSARQATVRMTPMVFAGFRSVRALTGSIGCGDFRLYDLDGIEYVYLLVPKAIKCRLAGFQMPGFGHLRRDASDQIHSSV